MRIRAVSLVLAVLFARCAFGAAGFQQVTIPDPQGKPIAAGIWYPSSAQPSARPLGMFSQTVAIDGKLCGEQLPLILISHGTGGSLSSHYDTAIALAEAGFVVVAPTHTGDNYTDQSYVGNRKDLIDRPRQIKLVIDWMLSSWTGRRNLNPNRVGIFGFSLGGFTSLVEIGGTPELPRMALLCATRPTAPECAFIANNHGDQLAPNSENPAWFHDARIKAAVIAEPAVSFLFGPGDLRNINIPVQLWRAEDDTQAPDAPEQFGRAQGTSEPSGGTCGAGRRPLCFSRALLRCAGCGAGEYARMCPILIEPPSTKNLTKRLLHSSTGN